MNHKVPKEILQEIAANISQTNDFINFSQLNRNHWGACHEPGFLKRMIRRKFPVLKNAEWGPNANLYRFYLKHSYRKEFQTWLSLCVGAVPESFKTLVNSLQASLEPIINLPKVFELTKNINEQLKDPDLASTLLFENVRLGTNEGFSFLIQRLAPMIDRKTLKHACQHFGTPEKMRICPEPALINTSEDTHVLIEPREILRRRADHLYGQLGQAGQQDAIACIRQLLWKLAQPSTTEVRQQIQEGLRVCQEISTALKTAGDKAILEARISGWRSWWSPVYSAEAQKLPSLALQLNDFMLSYQKIYCKEALGQYFDHPGEYLFTNEQLRVFMTLRLDSLPKSSRESVINQCKAKLAENQLEPVITYLRLQHEVESLDLQSEFIDKHTQVGTLEEQNLALAQWFMKRNLIKASVKKIAGDIKP